VKVLIVEDERITRQKLLRSLSQWGYEPTGVGTGDAAWEAMQNEDFSVVLTGLVMPVLTGFEVVQRIRLQTTLENYVYIIVVTGRNETEDVVQALSSGADDCITKPVHPGELHARLRTADRIITLQRQLVAHHQQMTAELDAAARYMRTMVPVPLEAPIRVDWRYIPCAGLSGDGFGYRWIDDDHFAMYLLDVSGHGIDAALL